MAKSPKKPATVTPIRRKQQRIEDVLTKGRAAELKVILVNLTKGFDTRVRDVAKEFGVELETLVDFKLVT